MDPQKKAPFTLEPHVFEPRQVLAWHGFTFAAGIVNAGAVVASDTVVTHITGSVTAVAVDGSLAAELVFVIALFIGGAMFATLVRETLGTKAKLGFVIPILTSASVLVGVDLAGRLGAFGEYGAGSHATARTYLMLGLLSASMGMLNSAVAGVTGNQVRTTHLSGPATDLAGNVVRGVLGTGKGTAAELRWAALRFSMLATFGVGAFVAAKLAGGLHFDVFALPALLLVGCLALATAPARAGARVAPARESLAAPPPASANRG